MVRAASKRRVARSVVWRPPSSVGYADTFSREGRRVLILISLLLAACVPPPPAKPKSLVTPAAVSPGLVPLPCAETGPLRPHTRGYCLARRHYVRAGPRAALLAAATALQARYPGTVIRYMEGSWPAGTRPMPPHLSHGDGRQLDLALFYVDRRGRPLERADPFGLWRLRTAAEIRRQALHGRHETRPKNRRARPARGSSLAAR